MATKSTKSKATKGKAAARRTGGNMPAPETRIEQAERRQLGTAPAKGASGYRTASGKVRAGLAVEEVTLNRLRAAAVDRNETLAAVVNRALRAELAKLEREHGKPYAERDARPRG